MGHPYIKKVFVAYMILRFDWVSCVLSGSSNTQCSPCCSLGFKNCEGCGELGMRNCGVSGRCCLQSLLPGLDPPRPPLVSLP